MIGIPDESPIEIVEVEAPQKSVAISTVIDTDVPITKLTKFISGYSWTVDTYFNKQIAENDIGLTADINTSAGLEQYIAINNFEVKLTTPIENISINNVEGECIISDIIPQEGDIFFARLIDNSLGYFTVYEVTHNLYNFRNIYTCKFKLSHILTTSTEQLFEDVREKSISTMSYDPNAFFDNTTPIVTEDILTFRKNADTYLNFLVTRYMESFFNSEYDALSVPVESELVTVDVYLNAFIHVVFEREHPYFQRMLRWGDKPFDNYRTPFYFILNRDTSIKSFVKCKRVSETLDSFTDNPYFQSLFYSGVELNTVYEDFENDIVKPIEGNEDTLFPNQDITTMLFSNEFYKLDDGVNLSLLEKLLVDFIFRKQVDYTSVLKLKDTIWERNRLEQFYYVPFIYMLLKYAKVNSYSLENTYAR